ncbi:MAG: tRNA(Met) cytidine acetyltransferase [Candidatus Odinarchaeota archaeon]|nr:tRNA(Met) cytidine acetyltransferase [Candidatus Odinarchaeota archaeon]
MTVDDRLPSSVVIRENKNLFEEDITLAVKEKHRRLFVLSGSKYDKQTQITLDLLYLLATNRRTDIKGAFVLLRDDVDTLGSLLKRQISDYFENKSYKATLKIHSFKSSDTLLGKTFDFLILDLTKNVHPDDLGRLVETVSGGGIIIFYMPNLIEFQNKNWRIHEIIVTPPYSINDIKHRYAIHFIRKLFEHEGIMIIDIDEEKLVKGPKEASKKDSKNNDLTSENTLKPPTKHTFPIEIYDISVTQDQIDAINTCELIVNKRGKTAVILIADRGRGKSATLGLVAAGFASVLSDEEKRRIDITVTAPNLENVTPVFDFFKKGLEALGITKIKESKSQRGELVKVESSVGTLSFLTPIQAINSKTDLLIVDEAAGIPVYVLNKLLEKFNKTIFSSTVHGYEGAGRGFSIRFLKGLEKRKGLTFSTYTLKEPIRYAAEDPIEAWLFDTLFLDAEPPQLDENDLADISKMNVTLKEMDLDSWFTGKNEEEAKSFIGIYVYAHYRNRPRDVIILADAPHHKAFGLELGTGKVVTAIQVATEGTLSATEINAIYKERKDFHGHIIPHAMIIHQRMPKFGLLKGLRIVRIATHPDVMNKGLGSHALAELSRYAHSKGYQYIGAVFGANEELLKFWLKNGFIPVHISPDRNPISGEHSVVVIKGLTKKAQSFVLKANNELRIRILGWLPEQLSGMDPATVALLLEPWDSTKRFPVTPPEITFVQWEKLHGYAIELMTYEATADALRQLVIRYFLDGNINKPKLNKKQKSLLITKLLQVKGWGQVSNEIEASVKWCFVEMVHIVRSLLKFYTTEEIWKKIGVHYDKAKPMTLEDKLSVKKTNKSRDVKEDIKGDASKQTN